MTPIQLAVIGYGGMGSYHATHILADETCVQVCGCFDIDEKQQQKGQAEGWHVYSSLEELLTDELVEAVLIATPNDSHKELVIRSLKAGKHVICEKPVTLTLDDFDEMVEVSKQTERTLMVHQNRRWDADFLIIRDLYRQQTIGSLFQLESRVHGANGIPGDWRHLEASGGGMLLDWGVHLLDQILFMVDSPLKSVAADLSYILGDEVDDGFVSYLTFADGMKVIVEVGTTNYIKLPRWYAKGTAGTALIQDWDLSGGMVIRTATEQHSELIPVQAGQGLTKTMAPPSESSTKKLDLPIIKPEYPSFYQNFYAVVRDQAEPIVKNAEVRNVLELMLAMFRAAETGQVIHFDLGDASL